MMNNFQKVATFMTNLLSKLSLSLANLTFTPVSKFIFQKPWQSAEEVHSLSSTYSNP